MWADRESSQNNVGRERASHLRTMWADRESPQDNVGTERESESPQDDVSRKRVISGQCEQKESHLRTM